MTFKETYNSIDQTQLPEKAKKYMEDFKNDSNNFKDEEAMAKMLPALNKFIDALKKSGYESAIKTPEAKKEEKPKKEKKEKVVKKTPVQKTKEEVEKAVEQPKTEKDKPKIGKLSKGYPMQLAKEIRKEGESWGDAMKRARQMINEQKQVVKKEAERQYEKLKRYIRLHPEVYPKDIPTGDGSKRATNLKRDIVREAMPKGARISKKGWKNQWGESKGGRKYYEYRSNRYDTRKKYPYLADGGEIDNYEIINYGGDRYDGGVVYAIKKNGEIISQDIIYGDHPVVFEGKEYDGLLDLSKSIGAKLIQMFEYAEGGEIERGAAHIYITMVNGNYKVYHGDYVTLRSGATPLFQKDNAKDGTWQTLWNDIRDAKVSKGEDKERGAAHIYITMVNGNYKVYHGDDVTLDDDAHLLYEKHNVKEGTWEKIWQDLRGSKYAKGGMFGDEFSLSKTYFENGKITEMVIEENVSVRKFEKMFSDKGYRKVADSSIVGFYYATPEGDTFQLVPGFHKKGEKKTYAKGGTIDEDDYSYAKTRGIDSVDFEKEVKEFYGADWDKLTDYEKEILIEDNKKEAKRSMSFAKGGSLGGVSKKEHIKLEIVPQTNLGGKSIATKQDITSLIRAYEKSDKLDYVDKISYDFQNDMGYAIITDKSKISNFINILDAYNLQVSPYQTYSKGGSTDEVVIGDYKKNILGTLSFNLKLPNMRKSQDFSVYPVSEKSDYIDIQSATRFGKIQMTTGRGLMTQSHPNGAYAVHMHIDKLVKFTLTESQLDKLKEELAKTAGSSVGSSVIKSDNTYADKFAKGGYVEEGEDYEYVNTFGIDQDDFEKLVDAYHKSPSYDQAERVESRLIFRKMREKYGESKIDEIGNYIHETHESHEHYAKGGMFGAGNFADGGETDKVNIAVKTIGENKYHIDVNGKSWSKKSSGDLGDVIINVLFYVNKEGDKKIKIMIDGKDETVEFKKAVIERYEKGGLKHFINYLGDGHKYAKGGAVDKKEWVRKWLEMQDINYLRIILTDIYYNSDTIVIRETATKEELINYIMKNDYDEIDLIYKYYHNPNTSNTFAKGGKVGEDLIVENGYVKFSKGDTLTIKGTDVPVVGIKLTLDELFDLQRGKASAEIVEKSKDRKNIPPGTKVKVNLAIGTSNYGFFIYATTEDGYIIQEEKRNFIENSLAPKGLWKDENKYAKGGMFGAGHFAEGGEVKKDKITLIFNGKEHHYPIEYIDNQVEDVELKYSMYDNPLWDYLESEFYDWLEHQSRDYEEMYFGEEAIYDVKGAIRGAIEVIDEVIYEEAPKKTTFNLDKGDVDFTTAFQ
jgi:hypothetical protein